MMDESQVGDDQDVVQNSDAVAGRIIRAEFSKDSKLTLRRRTPCLFHFAEIQELVRRRCGARLRPPASPLAGAWTCRDPLYLRCRPTADRVRRGRLPIRSVELGATSAFGAT